MRKFIVILQTVIPEGIAAVLAVSSGIAIGDIGWGWLLLPVYSLLLRGVWNSSLFIHGLGHTLAIALVDRQPSSLNLTNILEHRSVSATIKSLFPFQTVCIPGLDRQSLLWVSAGKTTAWRIRVKALAGVGLNLLAAALMLIVLALQPQGWRSEPSLSAMVAQYLGALFAAANLCIALGSRSDFSAFATGAAERFYCGNFGFIAKRRAEDGRQLLPARLVNLAQQMGNETEIRGEQAGGGLVTAQDGDQMVFVGKKVVNRKRQNLTQSLEAAFAPIRQTAIARGVQPAPSAITGVWHYRYATSGSPPSELETHWHEWMGARTADVWRVCQGEWVCETQNVNHRITHNGDFDAWILFGQAVDNATLGLWLERVLHTPNATLGDSPKIAGVMDLLITQGMWDASVRLAYQQAIAPGVEAAFGQAPHRNAPNRAPSPQELTDWAALFTRVFATHLPSPEASAQPEGLSNLETALMAATAEHSSMALWSEAQRGAFMNAALSAFLHNDVYQAAKLFMAGAKGSFGLATVSTLEPEQLALSAKGQPITIGFNWQQDYMVYASEPAAVDRVLLDVSGSSRIDLDQKTGEIAKVSADSLTIYSLSQATELTASELENRWLSLKYHPYLPYLQFPEISNAADPVASDIQAIPQVLNDIKASWRNPASLNRQSADYFADWLIKKAREFDQKQRTLFQAGLVSQIRQMPTVDLLLTGEENSLWLGERFAQDLKTVFPFLNIVTRSANQVLQQLSQDFSQLYLNRNSLILAISQSGQTFSTVQVINTFDQLCSQGIIGELFILTGELSSFINFARSQGGLTAIFQPSSLESTVRHRIFVNGSGRRTAEPATVSVAAAGQTLTELWLYLAKRLRKQFPDSSPLGMTLTPESLMLLDIMKQDFLENTVVQIVGTTATGEPVASSIHQTLVKGGRHWALHVTEAPLVWAIHALYVLVSVGWAIPFGDTLPLAKTVWGLTAAMVNAPQGFNSVISGIVTAADIAIYIFGPWLWTLLLRLIQGRQLLARMGKRTLVIGDVSWVSQLLQAYVSKLFSLSYGIASLEVHGSNPQHSLLHAFGHRVVRGTLILLGVPDGRRSPKQKASESAVLMTGKQANGVRHMNVGPEIVVMGHNPAIAANGFSNAIFLPGQDDAIYFRSPTVIEQKDQIDALRESCFGAAERLLAGYVFFWALAKRVASFPLLKYDYWKSQSRTKIMTTASPVAGLPFSKLFKQPRQPALKL